MRVFFPNFSFEDVVVGRHAVPDRSLRRVINALSPLTGLLGEDGDVVVVDANGIPSDIPDLLSHLTFLTIDEVRQFVEADSRNATLVPWGWDDSSRQLAGCPEFSGSIPTHDAVLTVNSRRFSAEFDIGHEVESTGLFDGHFGRLCHDDSQVQGVLRQLAVQEIHRWVMKPACSAAGRNRVLGQSTSLNTNQRGWLHMQLKRDGYIYLEPWLPAIRECGIQLRIPPTSGDVADIELIGLTEMITERSGRYRGSIVTHCVDPFWRPAIEHAMLVGRQAAELGYFGPLGIDTMQVELPSGQRVLRLCNDINGRLTMGRLALRLSREFGNDRAGVWLHSAVTDRSEESRSAGKTPAIQRPEIVEAVRVSPERIGGLPSVIDSWLYVTNGPDEARNLVESVRQHVRIQNG